MGKLPAYLEFLAQVTFDEFLHYWKKICFEKKNEMVYFICETANFWYGRLEKKFNEAYLEL